MARAEKREAAEHRRSLKRMSDLNLFEQDFVERRRRSASNETDAYDVSELDWDYYDYYYGEGDDYQVEIEGILRMAAVAAAIMNWINYMHY